MTPLIIIILTVYMALVIGLFHRFYKRVWKAAVCAERRAMIVRLQRTAREMSSKMDYMPIELLNTPKGREEFAELEGARSILQAMARTSAETLYDKTQ